MHPFSKSSLCETILVDDKDVDCTSLDKDVDCTSLDKDGDCTSLDKDVDCTSLEIVREKKICFKPFLKICSHINFDLYTHTQ